MKYGRLLQLLRHKRLQGAERAARAPRLRPRWDLRLTLPDLHARLTASTEPRADKTEDGAACAYVDAATLFVEGRFDGADALTCRRDGLLAAGQTYFVLPSRRLARLTVAVALASACLAADGKTLLTVEHGTLNPYTGLPEGDATVTIRNVC